MAQPNCKTHKRQKLSNKSKWLIEYFVFLLLLGSFNWIGEIQAIRSDFEIAVIEMLHILNDLSVLAEIGVEK
jgi:hypothetical protein